MKKYYRPIVQTDPCRPDNAVSLAGGRYWFDTLEVLSRTDDSELIPVSRCPEDVVARLSSLRKPICGMSFSKPLIMGILNVTPDSFSDGGRHNGPARAVAHAQKMIEAGCDLIDIGGESTRPGAIEVPQEAEIARTLPVISALRRSIQVPISIDTRKTQVARIALEAGANIVNDVSGFVFDPGLAPFCGQTDTPVCIMHSPGTPDVMQERAHYDDVVLDVYDFLETQIQVALSYGIALEQIIVDPGIGFGKSQAQNLALLRRISIFHGLGCPILLGASRKGFIRDIGHAPKAEDRGPGSVAVALNAVQQGVQILRVHDVADTAQALALWQAVTTGD